MPTSNIPDWETMQHQCEESLKNQVTKEEAWIAILKQTKPGTYTREELEKTSDWFKKHVLTKIKVITKEDL